MSSVLNSPRAGPSPRVRGSRRPHPVTRRAPGSIPACAGKPQAIHSSAQGVGVHPRVCGEAMAAYKVWPSFPGPSPRVRGSRLQCFHGGDPFGSIPACAGKPLPAPGRAGDQEVHPRVCGEAVLSSRQHDAYKGPSPRVRGSRTSVQSRAVRVRSIPACAGKPPGQDLAAGSREVHPRVCGEAGVRGRRRGVRRGPSPRVRGSPRVGHPAWEMARSIPACAGKPRRSRPSRPKVRVHPRVCGEAVLATGGNPRDEGPSPRVRGSPERQVGVLAGERSIPACAGKPAPATSGCRRAGVHPRVCGEACTMSSARRQASGPSPRVRGSPGARHPEHGAGGSIPACAGKPFEVMVMFPSWKVHPRVCGEAAAGQPLLRNGWGPSPRVRGSHPAAPGGDALPGSIPACAGKPGPGSAPSAGRRVHPRVCGEAPT